MKNPLLLALISLAALALGACSPSTTGSVPSLHQGSASAAAQGGAAALHAFGDCMRQHGIPGYQDPVVDSNNQVFYDSRSEDKAGQAVLTAAHEACRSQAVAAGIGYGPEPQAPPQLVQAGVRSAQCLRAHGLPYVRDPNANSPWTPGHGFGMSVEDFGGVAPAGGKSNPTLQAAFTACRSILDQEIQASTLSSLSHD